MFFSSSLWRRRRSRYSQRYSATTGRHRGAGLPCAPRHRARRVRWRRPRQPLVWYSITVDSSTLSETASQGRTVTPAPTRELSWPWLCLARRHRPTTERSLVRSRDTPYRLRVGVGCHRELSPGVRGEWRRSRNSPATVRETSRNRFPVISNLRSLSARGGQRGHVQNQQLARTRAAIKRSI